MLKVVEAAERGDFSAHKRIGRLASNKAAMDQIFGILALTAEVVNDDWKGFMALVIFVRQLLMWQLSQQKATTMVRYQTPSHGDSPSFGGSPPHSSASPGGRPIISTPGPQSLSPMKRISVAAGALMQSSPDGVTQSQHSKRFQNHGTLISAMSKMRDALCNSIGPTPNSKNGADPKRYASEMSLNTDTSVVTEKKTRLSADGPFHFWARRGLAEAMQRLINCRSGPLLDPFIEIENARGMTPLDLAAHKNYDNSGCVYVLRGVDGAQSSNLASKWPESIGPKSAKVLRDFGDDIDLAAVGGSDPLNDQELSRINALEVLEHRMDRLKKRAESRSSTGTATLDQATCLPFA